MIFGVRLNGARKLFGMENSKKSSLCPNNTSKITQFMCEWRGGRA